MPRAAVSGAYGFVGRHVSRHFHQQGWEVVGLGHGDWSQNQWKEWGLREWHVCDITLDALLTYAGEPDVIVHCAGSGSVGFSLTHPRQDYERTVATTLGILEFIRLHSPRSRLVYPSSAAVYGSVETLPIREDFPLRPASPHGTHKRMAEDLCRSYARHFGCSAVVVRLFSVYGPGLRKQLLWDACRKIVRNDLRFSGTGTELRDWLHAEDAAALLHAAAKVADVACPVVNGGSGQGVAVGEVVREVLACFGRDAAPTFSEVPRPGDPARYVADISLAREWGWRPAIPWKDGIRQYAEWFRTEGEGR